jgi:predicted transcriptional regulator of viral defense system
MNDAIRSRILSLLDDHGGFIRTADLTEAGIHNVYLAELVDEGTLVRIKNGLYIETEGETVSGFYETQLALPRSVICLSSALSYYNLSTFEPAKVHVAVPRDDRTLRPEFPPVRLFSFSGARYETGIIQEPIEGHMVRIYDREKTICDVIRFRRTLGETIAYESLRTYVAGTEKNLDRLLEYAGKLRMRRSVELMIKAHL